MRVAVIGIGKPENLEWAIDEPDQDGTDIDECIEALMVALSEGAVALGFEAPQFVPMRRDPMKLTAGRQGESGPISQHGHSQPALARRCLLHRWSSRSTS